LKKKEEIQKKLLFELEEEVKKISECINYDYKDYDYEIRICADD
jgi:hypothetical protein